MDENFDNNGMEENQQPKSPGLGEKLASGISKASDFARSYQQGKIPGLGGSKKQGGGTGLADKFSAKKNGDSSNKSGDNSKKGLLDSVNKKKDEVKNKQDNNKNKAKNPSEAITDEAKKKLNEMAFKKGVSVALDAAAPGAGQVAEKLLDTPLGDKSVEKARNSSNPVTAVINGTLELLKMFQKMQMIQNLGVFIPVLVVLIVVVIIILGVTSKFMDSQNYVSGYGNGDSSVVEMDPKYEKFYENLEKYGGSNKIMVLSVLTAYKDNDAYTDSNDLNSTVDSCTEEEISSGECTIETDTSGVMKYSKSKMKKYIKKVAKAISNSGGNIKEGDYNNPENTGSEFFQWLYTDFVEDYYSEYLDNAGDNLSKKKREIIHFIYLYYNDLNDEKCISSAGGFDTSCDFNLTTVEVMACDGKTKMAELSLKDYMLGVALAEIDSQGDDEDAFKAFTIVAKTFTLDRGGYDSSTKRIKIRSCTKDQVWCDIENGCNIYDYEGFDATYSKAYGGISGGSHYKSPLSSERKENWSKWYDEVYQYLYLDRNKYTGPITTLSGNPIGYFSDQQEYWYTQATKNNKKFDEVFAGTPSSQYFHFDSLDGEDLGLYDLGKHCSKISGGTTVAGKYVYYSQNLEPWSSMIHGCGSGKTFSAKGCLQTSSAMVLSSLLGREITPRDTNTFTLNNRATSCSGTTSYYTHFISVAQNYGVSVKLVANKTASSAQTMLDELAKGNLITQLLKCSYVSDICPTAFGGHAIVIVPGTKEGYVTVLDSAYPSKKSWEVTAEEATGANTQGSFYVWSVNEGTVISNELDSNNANLVTAGGLSNACTYTP